MKTPEVWKWEGGMRQEAGTGQKNGRQVPEDGIRDEMAGQVCRDVKQNEAVMSALLPIGESFDLI